MQTVLRILDHSGLFILILCYVSDRRDLQVIQNDKTLPHVAMLHTHDGMYLSPCDASK